MLCSGVCDPTTNSGCPIGTGCQVSVEQAGQMRTFSFCESSGSVGNGGTCTTSSDCSPEFDCVNDGLGNVCLQYCYVGTPMANCATCTPLSAGTAMTPLVLNGKQVGVCQ
jgi:hypothetical protein